MKMMAIAIATPNTVLIILTLAAALIIYHKYQEKPVSNIVSTAPKTSRCKDTTTLPGSSRDVGDGQQANTETGVGIAPMNMDTKDHLNNSNKKPALPPAVIKNLQTEAGEKPTGLPPW